MSLKLIIGNKNYSSWSFRPWIAMKAANIPFEEILIPLYLPGSPEKIREYSPAGKVPILIDDGDVVWESLAILEHLADRFPEAHLWPADARARSFARCAATEMHSGFQALRQHCTMNMWLPLKDRPLPPEVFENVKRIETIWADCRARFGNGGPFLFGTFTNVDAMYAPVVSRFHTYGLPVGPGTLAYMEAVMALPAWGEWYDAAMQETWVMQHNEPDWPLVRGKPVTQG
jgi:glutathione S-transferase